MKNMFFLIRAEDLCQLFISLFLCRVEKHSAVSASMQTIFSLVCVKCNFNPGKMKYNNRRTSGFICITLVILWSLLQLLATAVLTLFTHRGIAVNVDIEMLTSFLGNILTDTAEV